MTTIPSRSPAPDLGYAYTVDLCEAIDDSLDAAPPGAFGYKGADLTRAVARSLYMTLVNNETLKERYAEREAGTALAGFMVPTGAERLAAAALIGIEASVARPGLRSRLQSWRPVRSASTPSLPLVPEGGVLFVLHAPKFLRFAQSLIAAVDRPIVVNTGYDFTEALARLDVPGVPLDAWPATPGNCGPLLEDRADLLGAYDRFEACFEQLKPRAVVVFEGNHAFDELANRAAAARGIPCFCVQHGWSPIVHSGFRRLTFTELLVWGEGFAELLRPYNPDQSFIATGNPALAGSTRAGSDPVITFFAQGPSQLLSTAHCDDFLALACATAEAHPDARVVVRSHPSSPLRPEQATRLDRLANVELSLPEQRSLADVLAATHVSVSIYSTTILESAALLIPPVIYNTTSLPRYVPDVEALGAGIETGDRDSALAAIGRLLHDPAELARLEPGMRELRKRFFHGLDRSASERIAEVIG